MTIPCVRPTFNRENYLLLQKIGFTKVQAFVLLKLLSDNNPYSKKLNEDDFNEILDKLDKLLGGEEECTK